MKKHGHQRKQPKKSSVLTGYKRNGHKFIPPFIHKLGPIKGISYSRQTLPELIWWDVVIDKTSHKYAANLAATIATHFKGRSMTNTWWGFTSDYSKLNDADWEDLKHTLNEHHMLSPLQEALHDFLELYPACQLVKYLDHRPAGAIDVAYLSRFEKRLAEAENKRSRPAVLIQSQIVYMGFIIGKLVVKKGLSLSKFPEIEKYPKTELSLQVGASVCALVNGIAGQMLPDYSQDEWAQYFWNRSYEIRPIKMDHLMT
jgi:hypothetical protein